MGLCLLLFTQLSLKVEASESKTAGTKTEFGMKWPLKVILGIVLGHGLGFEAWVLVQASHQNPLRRSCFPLHSTHCLELSGY